jgi:hypothetical protein
MSQLLLTNNIAGIPHMKIAENDIDNKDCS